ncbi:hypothetical protein VKT23_007389 [Stygiomarasmius scandens]|uniref:Cytochrome P450 monooxygenase n=1 Tax=Marasmiellus scandens TaxID=2682957 RepID=A0ABR1JQX6_9AGAR
MDYLKTHLSNFHFTPVNVAGFALATFFLVHFIPWLVDFRGIRSYPGPLIAKFSDIWLGVVSLQGHRSENVHKLHEKYGTFVRIAPNHISVAAPDALGIIYAHGNGALKSEFYDAFVSIQRGVFNTRDRNEHTRKRKIISHIFSQKSVIEFEPQIRLYVSQLLDQWSRLYDLALQGKSGDEGEGGWEGHDGRLWLDCLPWCNYLAFDVIGDLAFGAPFGMLSACQDKAPVPVSQKAAIESYGTASGDIETREIPAVKILNGRGEYSMSMGALPAYWRPVAKKLPWFRQGGKDVKALAGIAIMAVRRRLAADAGVDLEKEKMAGGDGASYRAGGRNDLLRKLQEGKDDQGNLMGREELTAEALTLLIAGSDTTSNSTCAIIYYLASNPTAQAKLHAELDAALDPTAPATVENVKNNKLPYLDACIDEGLRIHSTSALGLPRIVPEGGMTIEDPLTGKSHFFESGTVVSVPSFTIHRDPAVWGEDVEAFRPERWFEGDKEAKELRNRTFNPFSVGPRGCVGKNLAYLELQIIVGSILRRFEFVLEKEGQQLETREGFLRKPLACRVGIRRRD